MVPTLLQHNQAFVEFSYQGWPPWVSLGNDQMEASRVNRARMDFNYGSLFRLELCLQQISAYVLRAGEDIDTSSDELVEIGCVGCSYFQFAAFALGNWGQLFCKKIPRCATNNELANIFNFFPSKIQLFAVKKDCFV